MRFRNLCLPLALLLTVNISIHGQKRLQSAKQKPKSASVQKPKEIGSTAVVIDETLSVLRMRPSLFANSVQRMRRGRRVQILGVAEADGVKFYRVSAPPTNSGWVQADAVFGKFREGDDARLAQPGAGFERIRPDRTSLIVFRTLPEVAVSSRSFVIVWGPVGRDCDEAVQGCGFAA